MKQPGTLRIGTRGSQMALVQTQQVADKLTGQNSELATELQIITTKGDSDNSPIPLDTVGKAWFTSEIEQALLRGEIDIAVHSLKDVPPETPAGLIVLPVLPRDDARDALVARDNLNLAELPRGAVIGTDSLRRKAQILRLRPDLVVKSVRGNANTRLEKLYGGDYDALILAAAGLRRIGKADVITELLQPDEFVPATGQGALAAEIRVEDSELLVMLRQLQDQTTLAGLTAEQSFTAIIGGGCKLPIGCYVQFDADTVQVYGMVGSIDATQCVIKTRSGPATEASALAKQLASELAEEPFVADFTDAA